MSKLYYKDQGFVIPTFCEDITRYHQAVKFLNLPKTEAAAKLFFLARPRSLDTMPLNISVNGHQLQAVKPEGFIPAFRWYEVAIPSAILKDGSNRLEFWSEGNALNAWTLAMDSTPPETSSSFVSLDGGVNWNDCQLGRFGRNKGEYLVRIRLEEGQDLVPRPWINEYFSHPRLSEIRALLPEEVHSVSTTLEKVRILSTWISQSCEYCSSAYASLYTPWDAAAILAWGRSQEGQNGQRPIVMCVHYGVTMITACQSLGIHARGSAYTEAINSFNGHFAVEVWLPELRKWIFVDPNMDSIFYENGKPLSVSEMRAHATDLSQYVEFGPGFDFQIKNPAIKEFMNIYLNGRFMKLRGLWPRADFLSHPELTPPGHGSLAYCETDFVWEHSDGLEMFPYFAGPDYFNAAPDEPVKE